MIRNPKPRRRFLGVESLEDRVVPSTASVAASTSAATYQAQFNELTGFNNATNPIYSSFAGTIFQAESSFGNPVSGTSASSTALSTLEGTVTMQVNALSRAIVAQIAALPGANSTITQLVQSQFTGPTSGSLLGQLTGLLNAAGAGSADGSVPQASLPLLNTAVDNAITMAYETTALDAYYFVTGGFSPSSSGGSGSAFSLSTVAAVQDAAWTTFASTVYRQEATLAGSTASAATTQAANTLSAAIVSSFNSTPATGNVGALQGFLNGPGSKSVSGQLSSLFNAATAGSTTGSVPSASLPLLYAAVDHAIAASFEATSVSSYLLATSPTYFTNSNNGSGTSGGRSGTGNTGTSTGGGTGFSGTSGRTSGTSGTSGSTSGTSGISGTSGSSGNRLSGTNGSTNGGLIGTTTGINTGGTGIRTTNGTGTGYTGTSGAGYGGTSTGGTGTTNGIGGIGGTGTDAGGVIGTGNTGTGVGTVTGTGSGTGTGIGTGTGSVGGTGIGSGPSTGGAF